MKSIHVNRSFGPLVRLSDSLHPSDQALIERLEKKASWLRKNVGKTHTFGHPAKDALATALASILEMSPRQFLAWMQAADTNLQSLESPAGIEVLICLPYTSERNFSQGFCRTLVYGITSGNPVTIERDSVIIPFRRHVAMQIFSANKLDSKPAASSESFRTIDLFICKHHFLALLCGLPYHFMRMGGLPSGSYHEPAGIVVGSSMLETYAHRVSTVFPKDYDLATMRKLVATQ
jgi:hypothetical protein